MSTGGWKEYFHLGYSLAKAELSISASASPFGCTFGSVHIPQSKGSLAAIQGSQERVSALETEAKE